MISRMSVPMLALARKNVQKSQMQIVHKQCIALHTHTHIHAILLQRKNYLKIFFGIKQSN